MLAASGLEIGDNVLEVDLRAVANRLEAEPWVRRAVVVRKPPDRLVVELVERQRFAWVVLDQTYGIDDEGVLLPANRLANETLTEVDLPVISGLTPAVDSLYAGMALVDTAGAFWRCAHLVEAGDKRRSRVLYGHFSARSTQR